MKKGKTRLASLFMMLLLSVLSLTGVTYAWFSQSDKASINQFTLDVESVVGLEISTDGMNWFTNITNFTYAGELIPVSTVGDVDASNNVKFFNGDYANGKLTNVVAAERSQNSSTKGYFALTLYFRNTGVEDVNVTLSDDDDFVTTVCSGTYEVPQVIYSSLAARVGFLSRNQANSDEPLNQILAKANTYEDFVIYEPNATTHLEQAIALGQATNGTKATTYGLKATGTGPYVCANASTLTSTFGLQETVTDPTETMFTINGDSIRCVTIYIWLEGQDCDCTNVVADHDLYVSLKFYREEQ